MRTNSGSGTGNSQTPSRDTAERSPWLLLIHQLPPTPNYLRVKVRRRLRRLGAVALKQTVYVLPNTDEALEDLQWLRQEIDSAGGSAIIAESRFVEGVTDEEIAAALAGERADASQPATVSTPDEVRPGRTWVTRADVHVDRMASAWLIKRFIDREAKFLWLDKPKDCPKKAVGFDFDGAEFTHVDNRVTFEVLLSSFGLEGDPGLASIGAAVHFLDVGGIPVADAKGLETVLRGAKEKARSDDALLADAVRILDMFYSAYSNPKDS